MIPTAIGKSIASAPCCRRVPSFASLDLPLGYSLVDLRCARTPRYVPFGNHESICSTTRYLVLVSRDSSWAVQNVAQALGDSRRRFLQAGHFGLLSLWRHDFRPRQVVSPRPLMVRDCLAICCGVTGGSATMSAYTGTRRSEDVIGAVDERSSLQWARRKIEEVKTRLRGDPGRAYSVEFTSAAEILREHDP